MSGGRQRLRLLHLALFDPTNVANGTTSRGRALLRHLAPRFETALLHVEGQFISHRDEVAGRDLVLRQSVPYGRAVHFGYSPTLHRAALRLARDFRPDVVLADVDKASLYARAIERVLGIPYVYSSHNVERERYRDLGRTDPIRLAMLPWVAFAERLGVRGAYATIAISATDAELLRQQHPRARIVPLPLAFDETTFNPDVVAGHRREPVALMVGDFGYPPNLHGLRRLVDRVVPVVRARHPQLRFRFVGHGLPAEDFGPGVELAGFVDDLVAEYARAALVLVPVEAGGGIKIKTVEALACGRPVVSTPKGVEGIDTRGMALVHVGAVEEFPDLIDRALAGPDSTRANTERVRTEFGVQHQLDTLVGLLESAAAARVRG